MFRPKVGEPTRISTTISIIAPLTQVMHFDCPGGSAVVWMPRIVPRRDCTQLICATDSWWPTAC